MKNVLITALFLSALFLISCENAQKAQNSANIQQNKNASTETKSKEVPTERHIKIKSENSFDETYAALKKAIELQEPLTIIAELDHSANAKKAGMELRPTKVIMFGNPKLGTPLMKSNQAIGVDLPQKMLVYEDEKGDVYVVYNDPKILAENHGISGQDEVLNKISEALKSLAEAATR
ncbi:hypothetical protein BH20ACI1_BH20ACI1_18880 [soil metagenome]